MVGGLQGEGSLWLHSGLVTPELHETLVKREKKYYVVEGRLCKLNSVEHTCDASTQEAEARELSLPTSGQWL